MLHDRRRHGHPRVVHTANVCGMLNGGVLNMTRSNTPPSSTNKPTWAMKNGRRVVRPARLTPEKLESLAKAGYAPRPQGTPTPSLETVLRSIDEKLTKNAEQATAPTTGRYLTVVAACKQLLIGKTKFYELVPALEREGIAFRVPPPTGPLRIDFERLVEWLKLQPRPRRGKQK
jgi:hypothetical protein